MSKLSKIKNSVPLEGLRDRLLKDANSEQERQAIRRAYSDKSLRAVNKSFKENLYPAIERLSKE